MSIGITLSAAPAANTVDYFVETAAMAADEGVHTVWIGQFFDVDALSLAALIGRVVPDIDVGTAVVPMYPRHPLVVAAQALTAQAASSGRFHLGMGLGSRSATQAIFGVTPDRPIRHAQEYIGVLRDVFATGSADVHGETLTAVTPGRVLVPGAESPPPILLGAVGDQALRVAGKLADGTFPYLASPETLAESIVPVVTAAAAEAGRPAPRIVMVLPAVVTSDVDAVRANTAEQMAVYDQIPEAQISLRREGAQHADEMAVIGDEETVAAAIDRYFEAGATELSIAYSHFGSVEDQHRTFKLIGELNRARTNHAPLARR